MVVDGNHSQGERFPQAVGDWGSASISTAKSSRSITLSTRYCELTFHIQMKLCHAPHPVPSTGIPVHEPTTRLALALRDASKKKRSSLVANREQLGARPFCFPTRHPWLEICSVHFQSITPCAPPTQILPILREAQTPAGPLGFISLAHHVNSSPWIPNRATSSAGPTSSSPSPGSIAMLSPLGLGAIRRGNGCPRGFTISTSSTSPTPARLTDKEKQQTPCEPRRFSTTTDDDLTKTTDAPPGHA